MTFMGLSPKWLEFVTCDRLEMRVWNGAKHGHWLLAIADRSSGSNVTFGPRSHAVAMYDSEGIYRDLQRGDICRSA